MFAKKTSIFLALLFSTNVCINGYDVTQLLPFGKTAHAITAAIKQLTAKKITLINPINEHFHKQEEEILKKIMAQCGVSPAVWNQQKQLFDTLVAHDPLYKPSKGSYANTIYEHPIIKKTRELIAKMGMNPNAITILDSEILGTAGVSTWYSGNIVYHNLHLNIPELAELPIAEYTAIIKHELQHLWYGDALRIYTLREILPPSYDEDTILSDLRKNFEMRADIMSVINNPNDINYLYSSHKKYMQLDSLFDSEHPTFAQRIKALEQLKVYLIEEKKYSASAA